MDTKTIDRIVKEALSLGKKTLVEPDAKEVLRCASIPVPHFTVVKDVTGAVEAAKKIGYPVALKIISPDIVHKSDVHGVHLGIQDSAGIEEKWSHMIFGVAEDNPLAMIEGFLVEEMAPRGAEVIIGAVKDPQFGTIAMFGIGGVAVEIMKDVSFRLGPVDRDDALSMISEVKGFPLLMGYRGDTVKDLDAAAEVLVNLSRIVDGTDGLNGLEINPLMLYERGAVAVDARGVLGVR